VICGICSYALCTASSELIHQTSCHSVALGVPWGVAGYSAMEVALRSVVVDLQEETVATSEDWRWHCPGP